jgi:hypothetical protein
MIPRIYIYCALNLSRYLFPSSPTSPSTCFPSVFHNTPNHRDKLRQLELGCVHELVVIVNNVALAHCCRAAQRRMQGVKTPC